MNAAPPKDYPRFRGADPVWIEEALAALSRAGVCLIEGVLDRSQIEKTRRALYAARDRAREEAPADRREGELGVVRLALKYHPHFFSLLELPAVLALVDRTVSETAILHLQNGFILPSFENDGSTPKVFQNSFHRDFPRFMNGYLASVNIFFLLDDFTARNGATLVVPGSHQRAETPERGFLEKNAVPLEGPAGSIAVFDSTLWHAAGRNVSGTDRLAVNQQFTRSFLKQQIDCVRALGDETVLAQKPRTQQLLGWYSRVPTSLEEFYLPEDRRLYRKGQG